MLNNSNIIKLLRDNRWSTIILKKIDKLDIIPDEIIDELILQAVYESDVSANGYYIEPCKKKLGVKEISRRVLPYILSGSDEEKMGAIKLFYWLSEPVDTWYDGNNDIVQLPISVKATKEEYLEIQKILVEEYKKCKNPVLRFYFQWALPDEREVLLKNEPKTSQDLIEIIKDDYKLIELFESLRRRKKEEEKDFKYIFFEYFLLEFFLDSMFYGTKLEVNEKTIYGSFNVYCDKFLKRGDKYNFDLISDEIEKIRENNDWQYLLSLEITNTENIEDIKAIANSISKIIMTINNGSNSI